MGEAARPGPSAARDDRSDELKAAAIVGVVGIHVGWPYADVFRYCVPVFVAVWAFHYEQGLARRPDAAWPYARQRFIRLLIPYAFWTLLYLGRDHPPGDWAATPVRTIVGDWFGGNGWAGQYFFIIVFQLTVLMPVLRRGVTPGSVWAVLVGGAAVNAVAVYWLFDRRAVAEVGDRLFVYWLPYLFLGVAFARGYPPARRGYAVGALALLAAPAAVARLAAAVDRPSAYLLPSVTVGTAALLLAFASRYPHPAPARPAASPVVRAVRYVGRNSFAVYVSHLLVYDAILRLGPIPVVSGMGSLDRVVTVAGAIGGGLAIGWILQRLGLGILVGK